MDALRRKVLALVLAGGEGGRLEVLTDERAKPAMPYAGVYRLIDFPLSNCRHSGISDVWVLQQYEPHSVSDHLANGRPWDLDRTHGGLRVLHPHLGDAESGWYRGNADAIHRSREPIEELGADLILVLSADHVYKLDYRAVIARHVETGAEVTMVTARVPRDQASRYGTVEVDENGRVRGFAYKPEEPDSDVVTTEVFVYDRRVLLEALAELAGEDEDGGRLEDFGDALLPRLVERGSAYAFGLEGYWKDVGTIDSYWQAHMDLLAPEPALDLDEPGWPILTLSPQRPPARIAASARIDDSLVSPGSAVRGEVARSVLASGVVVEEGATVRECVLLENVVVESGATVECAIVDTEARIARGARVGKAVPAGRRASAGEIAIVAQRASVAPGAQVPPGAHVEPGASAG